MASAEKIIEKYKNGQTDEVTGKPVTEQAKQKAARGALGFFIAEMIKLKINSLKTNSSSTKDSKKK